MRPVAASKINTPSFVRLRIINRQFCDSPMEPQFKNRPGVVGFKTSFPKRVRYDSIVSVQKSFLRGVLRALCTCASLLGAGVVCADAGHTRPLMQDFIGINGHTVQFKPELYRPVCGLVRDGHPVRMGLGQGSRRNFTGGSRFREAGVDWNQVYGSWSAKGGSH